MTGLLDKKAPRWTGRDYAGLALSILICNAAGGIGALASDTGSSEWYRSLNKPPFNPPAWIFAPVWTLLYSMMGAAAWMIYRREHPRRRWALGLFGAQLLLNAAWTPVFFALHAPAAALGVIVALWAMIAATMLEFWRIWRPAALLLAPYLAWTSFAAVLNAAIVERN